MRTNNSIRIKKREWRAMRSWSPELGDLVSRLVTDQLIFYALVGWNNWILKTNILT